MSEDKKSIFRWLDGSARRGKSERTPSTDDRRLWSTQSAFEDHPGYLGNRDEGPEVQGARQKAHEAEVVRDGEGQMAPSRWVNGPVDVSPYGFADDDGTVRQVESVTWRRAFGNKSKSQYFIPTASKISSSAQESPYFRKTSVQAGRFRSLLLLQSGFAAVLLFSGVYAHQSNQPMAAHVDRLFAQVFDTDYTNRITPKVDAVFAQYHISLPTFGESSSGTTLQSPVNGTITADYVANSHPEIWLAAPAGSAVVAVGTGSVTKAQSAGNGQYLVEIDNGQDGYTLYVGMQSMTVKVGETVYSGQVIGRLPNNPERPILRFSMLKNNQFENPHEFIRFSESAE